MKTPAKILFLDIETAPSLGWVWAKYETNVIDYKSDWYILSVGYRWAHEKKIHVLALPDYAGYNPDGENDLELLRDVWKLIDEADVIVAHNGDSFDLPKLNTRFLIHGMQPPSPYKTVDTLKIARTKFKFDSNKLDDLCHYLNLGRKLPHTGFHLWRGCMIGKPASWKTMREYNKHDVKLLSDLYKIVMAWSTNHPNVNKGQIEACPKCSSIKVQRRGFSYTALRKKQRFRCISCSGWFEGPAKAL